MSRRSHTLQRVFVAALGVAPLAVGAAQTRMLRSPTVSKTQIAFAYANNVWTVDRNGGLARRLTSFQGTTENPKFSPDGKLIAFSAQYAGNVDVSAKPHQQRLKQPPTSGLRDWRKQMSALDVAAFEHVAGDLLRALGYETSHGPDASGRAKLAWYDARTLGWRAASFALRRSFLWRRRHPPLR